jgi:hypothetical protein
MKNLILTLIITLPLTLWGQGWEQTFGGPNNQIGKSIQQTTDGGYIITGYTNSFVGNGGYDVYLLKIDENGNVQWSKTFGGNEYDSGNTVQQTTDGGYIIGGYTSSFGNGEEVYLIKTDENGNELWSQTFGGSETESYRGSSLQQTTDGGFIITGTLEVEYNSSYDDIYLIKTDENGNEEWTQTFGGEGNEISESIQQTTDGGYIITGETSSFGNGYELYLIKTDENGNEQWSKTFDVIYGRSVQQTTDGGYILLGQYWNGTNDICLIKTDENGNEQWSQTFGGGGDEIGYSIQQTTDGGYIMVGYTNSFGNGTQDVYLIKTDENGNELWSQTFGDIYSDKGFSIDITTDEGYIITGSKQFNVNGNPFTDVYVIKTNQFGNITSTTEIQLPDHNRKLEKTINLKGQEVNPKTNQPIIEIFDDGTTQKKIIIE